MQNTDLQRSWDRIVHLVECVQRGSVELTHEDVFDPVNRRYGYPVALAFVAQYSLAALGLPFPAKDKTLKGGENHGNIA